MKKPSPRGKQSRDYAGLNLHEALRRVRADFPELRQDDIIITYAESALPRFTVISCRVEEPPRLHITAASPNPLRHLPANYQDNAFLRGFLMVFQHIANETLLTLDNLDSWFRPMECPAEALAELARWLGADTETAGSGEEFRRYLRSALPLYRARGTARGMAARLGIACGITPRVIEGEIPSSLVIRDEGETESRIFEEENAENCFTLRFPSPRGKFSEEAIHRISRIAREEKPAHTRCFISFDPPERKRRKITTLRGDTRIAGETLGETQSAGGFFI